MLPQGDRTLVMGVLNVTPDSFSDGGDHFSTAAAIEHGIAMAADGADLIDVGGESTRPGAARIDEGEEQRRIVPVIKELAAQGIIVSADTMRASTARLALEAGATLINDVSGGLADPDMIEVASSTGCGYIAMHWRGHSDSMQNHAHYANVVEEVRAELSNRIEILQAAGVKSLAIDPGIGFAKEPEHNWDLLAHLDRLTSLGLPVLVGASRKRFLGVLLARAGEDRDIDGREAATIAITALAARAGVWAVRVHNVRDNVDAVKTAQAWRA